MPITGKNRLLGIMAEERTGRPPFASSAFYRQLCLLGAREGILVFVFSPGRIDWQSRTVKGYTYVPENSGWEQRTFELPALVYDRCFCANKDSYTRYRLQAQRLRRVPGLRFLGHGLPGKWEVQQMLQKDAVLQAYLPETCPLTHRSQLYSWLDAKSEACLKPQGGSQGKGLLLVRRQRGAKDACTYHIRGRDADNEPVCEEFDSYPRLWSWLRAFMGARPYLMQEYATLHTLQGTAFDIRSLVQKSKKGRWQTTGMAVRCGRPGSITSNLHGGGTAEELTTFLTREFGAAAAGQLGSELERLSACIPVALEAAHGRLAELGIDMGIDREGRIWILEVNSKPGRSVFAQTGDDKARFGAVSNLIGYASFLLQHCAAIRTETPERQQV